MKRELHELTKQRLTTRQQPHDAPLIKKGSFYGSQKELTMMASKMEEQKMAKHLELKKHEAKLHTQYRLNKLSRHRGHVTNKTPPLEPHPPTQKRVAPRPRIDVLRRNSFIILSDDPHIKGAIGAMERVEPSFMMLMKQLQPSSGSNAVFSFKDVVDITVKTNSYLSRPEIIKLFKLVDSPEELQFRYLGPKAMHKRTTIRENADVSSAISAWWRSIRESDKSMSQTEKNGFTMRKRRFSVALDLQVLYRRAHNLMTEHQYESYIAAVLEVLPTLQALGLTAEEVQKATAQIWVREKGADGDSIDCEGFRQSVLQLVVVWGKPSTATQCVELIRSCHGAHLAIETKRQEAIAEKVSSSAVISVKTHDNICRTKSGRRVSPLRLPPQLSYSTNKMTGSGSFVAGGMHCVSRAVPRALKLPSLHASKGQVQQHTMLHTPLQPRRPQRPAPWRALRGPGARRAAAIRLAL
jgi:hypothetical protein